MEHTEADYGRALVLWGYSEQGGAPGSVFEQFSGKGKAQSAQLKPSKVHDGYSPTRVYASESRRQKESKLPISSGHCGGFVRRAIATLPALEQSWVNHCYNPSQSRKAEAGGVVLRMAVSDFEDRHPGGKGSHSKTRSMALAMLRSQINEASSYRRLCLWSDRMPPEYGETISAEQWKKTYRGYWKLARLYVLGLDNRAMTNVARNVRQSSA